MQKTSSKINVNLILPIITLNELNSPVKRQRLADGLKNKTKHDPTSCCLQETQIERHKQVESKRMGKRYLQIVTKRELY